MIKFFSELFETKPKEPLTSAEIKLEKIKQILFPPLELRDGVGKNGEPVKYHLDYAADSNLDAVLNDIEEGYVDETCHKTLNEVVKKLHKIRKILGANFLIDKDAEYIKVATESEFNPDDIVPME